MLISSLVLRTAHQIIIVTKNNLNLQIAHHGAELNNGWFMRPHSSVIEVVMHKFQGIWPDFYYRSLFRTENIILYWRADVTKEETWRPGVFEESGNSGEL